MKLRISWIQVVLTITLFAFSGNAQTLKIRSIQARLFYENTGTFSENVLTDKGFDLWNTPFDQTYSVLIAVEIEGVPRYLEKPRQIELTAKYIPFDTSSRSITLKQADKIRNGSETGLAYAGFWIKNVGCEPVFLTARIAGQKRFVKNKINFGCGE